MTKTCGKCQAIPRYSLSDNKVGRKPVQSCWPHLQRQIDELLDGGAPVVEVRRSR